jgi:hypothetical protein
MVIVCAVTVVLQVHRKGRRAAHMEELIAPMSQQTRRIVAR